MAARDVSCLLATVALAALVSACAAPSAPADPVAQRLVGRWSQVFTFNDIRDEIAIDLRPDATVEVKVRRHSGTGINQYAGSGKWRVEEDHFVCELAWTGPRDAVNHLVGRRRILSVTDWQWVSEYRNQEQLTAWRYPK
jgi:hypothetical protein